MNITATAGTWSLTITSDTLITKALQAFEANRIQHQLTSYERGGLFRGPARATVDFTVPAGIELAIATW